MEKHMHMFPARIVAGFVFFVFLFIFFTPPAIAQTPTPVGIWQQDSEVTAVGRGAVRAREFLDWTLNPNNQNWVFLTPTAGGVNQIAAFWEIIRNITYVLTLFVVLVTALLLIITRGRNFNLRRQVLIIGAVLLLVTLSFDIVRSVYWVFDNIQLFFLDKGGGDYISTEDLLFISFGYDFLGYRLSDPQYDETVNVSLFLTKATSITYYVMAGILLVRKIILWFFIILSPLWVLLLPFPLIRNTAKIWVGEFFRWILYGPLFAVLLGGLVKLWQLSIPLNFPPPSGTAANYPTAINILLGGPGDTVTMTSNLSNINQYAKYVIALLMLWTVILLPFLLLKIFRDALSVFLKEDNALLQKAFNAMYPFFGRGQIAPATPPSTVPSPPPPPTGEGLARETFLSKPAGLARNITIQAETANIEALPQAKTTDIVKFAGVTIPTLRDLARMEMQRDRLVQSHSLLRNIATPTSIGSLSERSRFSSIQQELLTRSRRGDVAASTILAAAESARTGQPVAVGLGSRLTREKTTTDRTSATTGIPVGGGRTTTSTSKTTQAVGEHGQSVVVVGAGRIGQRREGPPITAAKPQALPVVNRMQTVGIEDYEDVKKMWEENYRSGEIPISEKVKSRAEWLKQDITKISSVIELVSSVDDEKKKQGLTELAIILPFLLLGGFSDQETVVYLKAKLEAAKKVLTELEQKVQEEDKILVEGKKEEEGKKEMEAQVEEPEIPSSPSDQKKLAQSKEQEGTSVNLRDKIEGKPTSMNTNNKKT